MNSNMRLTDLKTKDKAYIKEISKGCQASKRLYELGLHKGVKFVVEKNDRGPIILRLGGNKLALGRGLAEKVLVEKSA